eukprot:g38226.t1
MERYSEGIPELRTSTDGDMTTNDGAINTGPEWGFQASLRWQGLLVEVVPERGLLVVGIVVIAASGCARPGTTPPGYQQGSGSSGARDSWLQ